MPLVGVDASWELAASSLWKDVLGLHSRTPIHCMVGGGDQLYQDGFFQVDLYRWRYFAIVLRDEELNI